MNKIGVIGAMKEEVDKLYSTLDNKKEIEYGNWTFYTGCFGSKEVVIVMSGIGKVNMAACTQALIDKFDVDYVINTGVAGSLDSRINIGDIVVSTDCIQHDMDAVAFGYPRGVIPQMAVSVWEADKEGIDLAKKICAEVNPDIQIFEGRVLSGDVFVASSEKKLDLVQEFEGSCTEMEGAAMAQVAYLNKVPFLVLRAISDKADDSAKVSYAEFELEAIRHLVLLVKTLIERI